MQDTNGHEAVSSYFQKIDTNVTFKPALNGFNREEVIYYVDKLKSDFTKRHKLMSEELDSFNEKNIALTQQIKKHEETINELARRLKYEYSKPDILKSEREKFAAQVEALNNTIQRLEQELMNQKAHSEEIAASLRQSIANTNSAREQVKQISERLYASNTQLQQAQQQLAIESSRAQKLQQAVEYFKSQSNMYASRCNDMAQTERQNRELKGSLTELERSARAASVDNLRLREEITKLNERLLQQQIQRQPAQPQYQPAASYAPQQQYQPAASYAPQQQYQPAASYTPQPQYQPAASYTPQPQYQPAASYAPQPQYHPVESYAPQRPYQPAEGYAPQFGGYAPANDNYYTQYQQPTGNNAESSRVHYSHYPYASGYNGR